MHPTMSPMAMHVPNIVTQVQQCMSELAAMTSEQILWQYGYPGLRLADAVRNRSRDMLERGR